MCRKQIYQIEAIAWRKTLTEKGKSCTSPPAFLFVRDEHFIFDKNYCKNKSQISRFKISVYANNA